MNKYIVKEILKGRKSRSYCVDSSNLIEAIRTADAGRSFYGSIVTVSLPGGLLLAQKHPGFAWTKNVKVDLGVSADISPEWAVDSDGEATG